ncbi:hypothetical protein CLAFUW4_02208 [Fulvia fulva]|uniref:Cytidyltransferase-like domain-containing protein n=1 Tax=Passalora fulva TaxID=5499 RepID=A0A9Q8L8Z7_PASFU|nr:uncharacterized protein CLAFUR5_02198 [Fulvia fulva]KAK4634440.1 hypothetical protein CLAFUR4_02203 [Fulvia fulva]KAK4636498.1 hypothetical protein CLAFUR0_02206 [Fulvia fulva]UJO12909.1 hypothetical protein CLAFUR5_02198 [Fulvia fulva]WPV08426.1 hypothetical protein CLAFUW4_02208 [Fulvia fulva]WPV24969.1 hypothetical protein CLAFUW7_02208 [Fulvia fulva]
MSLERVQSGEPPRYLLLLPPAPEPATASALKSIYGETVIDVLKEVAAHSSETSKASVLEVALACPHLVDAHNKSRSSLYDQTQSLVAGVYKLVTVIATQENINIEDFDGVDVRVILVAWSGDDSSKSSGKAPYGPIVDIGTLARSGRQWQFAFGVESEAGESIFKAFAMAKASTNEVGQVQSGSDSNVLNTTSTSEDKVPSSTAPESLAHDRHYDVAVGGTWDHLHIGHKLLITMTIFAVDDASEPKERSATIGITGDQLLVKKKHANLVESWTDRQKAVATFFNAILDFSQPASSGQRHASIRDDPEPNGKSIDIHYPNGLVVKCTEIQDLFGPTITEEKISALVISAETRSGGRAVNDKRKEQGWKELDVFEVDVLDAEEEGQGAGVKEGFDSKISSTAIREKLARKSGGKM